MLLSTEVVARVAPSGDHTERRTTSVCPSSARRNVRPSLNTSPSRGFLLAPLPMSTLGSPAPASQPVRRRTGGGPGTAGLLTVSAGALRVGEWRKPVSKEIAHFFAS